MKVNINASLLKQVIGVLVLLLFVKLVWFVAEVIWLPVKSIDHAENHKIKPLYYHVKLTSSKNAAPIVKKKPAPVSGRIQDIKLLGVYHASDNTVIAVSYKQKTKILAKGESINGFTLEGAGSRHAVFGKDGKQYRISIEHLKGSKADYREILNVQEKSQTPENATNGEIMDAGDHKIIDRSLIQHYTQDMNSIYKDIGIQEIKQGETIHGFRVTFVKRGTPFAKLGLHRGDILKSINGQVLDSYNAAFEAYRNINEATNVTLKIQRGNKEMELEYEIN